MFVTSKGMTPRLVLPCWFPLLFSYAVSPNANRGNQWASVHIAWGPRQFKMSNCLLALWIHPMCIWGNSIPGGPKKRNSRYSQFFRTLIWSTVIFFTLLDRASFPHYNNTKIIKFGWELFSLWVISLIWTVIFGICLIYRVPRHD